ncbi:MAG TPA: hypothetical protein EYP59_07145 [Thiotrichaceae bacterium]|nr:hypothetical protein [Thiotrichaceae bacterium]
MPNSAQNLISNQPKRAVSTVLPPLRMKCVRLPTYSRQSTALYLGPKASRSNVFALNDKQELDDYRYVMFSLHGVIPSQFNQIAQPALVLSHPLTDGYLTTLWLPHSLKGLLL